MFDERSTGCSTSRAGCSTSGEGCQRAERDVDERSGMSTSEAGCRRAERHNNNLSSFGLPLFCSNHSSQQQANCNARIDRREIRAASVLLFFNFSAKLLLVDVVFVLVGESVNFGVREI